MGNVHKAVQGLALWVGALTVAAVMASPVMVTEAHAIDPDSINAEWQGEHAKEGYHILHFTEAKPGEMSQEWLSAHFPKVDVTSAQFWRAEDKGANDTIFVVAASGATGCEGGFDDEQCAIVAVRSDGKGLQQSVAYAGTVCPDPNKMAISQDHRRFVTCDTVHDLK